MTERPRDSLGRPLRPDAEPTAVAEAVVDLSGADDDAVWAAGVAYLARGLPFHAHEVFEARWRSCEAADRVAWRALAQWGAALTHDARGNAVGARRLAERARVTLDAAGHVPGCVDVVRVRRSCAELAVLPGPPQT